MPNGEDFATRGEPGSLRDDAEGLAISYANSAIRKVNSLPYLNPATQVTDLVFGTDSSLGIPEIPLTNKQLPAAWARDVVETAATAFIPGLGGKSAGKKGTSGVLTTANGKRWFGNSTGSSASGGAPRAPMHPMTQQALDSVRKPSRSHSHCCEIDSINKALNAGDDVRGATMGPVRLNETGRILPACSTCREVKKIMGVE